MNDEQFRIMDVIAVTLYPVSLRYSFLLNLAFWS